MDKFLDYGKYAGVKDFMIITAILAIAIVIIVSNVFRSCYLNRWFCKFRYISAIMIMCGREQSDSQTLLARQQMRLLNREKGKVGNTNGKIMGTLET